MAVKKRCIRCLTILNSEGNCVNEKCVRYIPPVSDENTTETAESAAGEESNKEE